MCGCHCAAVEPHPGRRAASAQTVAASIVGGCSGETMRLGYGREREKGDAGRDNAFHAGSLDVVKAVVATPVRYRRASGLPQMRLPNQPNCICCAAMRAGGAARLFAILW